MIFLSRIVKKYYFYITGFLVGIANGLFGSGGGMIAVPMLEKGGIEPKKAHASSIAITLALSVISGFVYFASGEIDIVTAAKFVPLGAVGAFVGAKLLKKFSDKNLHRIFGAIMIIAGIRMFFKE